MSKIVTGVLSGIFGALVAAGIGVSTATAQPIEQPAQTTVGWSQAIDTAADALPDEPQPPKHDRQAEQSDELPSYEQVHEQAMKSQADDSDKGIVAEDGSTVNPHFYDDSHKVNGQWVPNGFEQTHKQAEDGTWVPNSFYGE